MRMPREDADVAQTAAAIGVSKASAYRLRNVMGATSS